VLTAVKRAVTALALVTLAVAGMVQVTGLVAPAGSVDTTQVKLTVPVNPFAGVTVIVDVLFAVAPGLMEIAPLLLRLKPGVVVEVPATARTTPTVWTCPWVSVPMSPTLKFPAPNEAAGSGSG